MGIISGLITRVVGSGRVTTAAHDVPMATGQLARHLARASDLPMLDAISSTPGRWYHSTASSSVSSIVANGFQLKRAGSGMYGAGMYFSSIPDASYGAGMVSTAVHTTNPFVVREGSRMMDVQSFQQAIRPVVDRFALQHPDAAASLGHAELARRSLRAAGHDSILITRRAWEPTWLVALTEDAVKILTAPAGP